MATAEITIIPIGTGSTSTSDFVVEAERILADYPEVTNKLTGMGTELECNDVEKLFDVLKEMHLAPFNRGSQRIYSIIKIDDRRDKESTLEEKIASVSGKMA